MQYQGSQPLWSSDLLEVMLGMAKHKHSLSPVDYPHAAEDIQRALEELARADGVAADVAVFSSISPWVEMTLLSHSLSKVKKKINITTVDFNVPIIASSRFHLHSLARPELAKRCARQPFQLIVSFSGIEHDGLGRYGDPIHPNGDMAAMREMAACLRPDGHLLLAVPICGKDALAFPVNRVYGPTRLPMLLQHWNLKLRVWDGVAVWGNLSNASKAPPLYANTKCTMRDNYFDSAAYNTAISHQPVLVLQKRGPRGQ